MEHPDSLFLGRLERETLPHLFRDVAACRAGIEEHSSQLLDAIRDKPGEGDIKAACALVRDQLSLVFTGLGISAVRAWRAAFGQSNTFGANGNARAIF